MPRRVRPMVYPAQCWVSNSGRRCVPGTPQAWPPSVAYSFLFLQHPKLLHSRGWRAVILASIYGPVVHEFDKSLFDPLRLSRSPPPPAAASVRSSLPSAAPPSFQFLSVLVLQELVNNSSSLPILWFSKTQSALLPPHSLFLSTMKSPWPFYSLLPPHLSNS